ncbi:hypothetical protein BKA62DRAFT_693526 [Auriculariales sp. MPI-PUGE-AT-0066]|nr:hypothetical protein BKA62DRAFT_693526 [Auriculariales sp. MPI-PUGE-AT-0066]
MLLLDTLPSAHIIASALQSQNHPAELADPTYKTLSVLSPDSGLCFNPAHLYLVPAHTEAPVPSTAQAELQSLTIDAQQAAAVSSCSSILAGTSSESDEYGDIAVWLGGTDDATSGVFEGDNRENAVITALGLAGWLEKGAKMVKDADGTVAKSLMPSPALERVDTRVTGWEKTFALRVEGGPGSVVLFVLAGLSRATGWQALLGIGVWT